MNSITLFNDQEDLVYRVRQRMKTHKSILIQSATGSGKTVLGAYMIQAAAHKGTDTMFIVPRRALLKQTADTLNAYRMPFGYISAGYTPNPFARCNLATLDTLARRLDKTRAPKLAFVDETHFGADSIDRVIAWLRSNGSWIVGLSATPMKTSGRPMSDWYDIMECGLQIGELIRRKRLSEYRLFAPSAPDLTGIKTTAGDYAKGQLASRMEGDRVLIGNAVRHYREHAMGRLNAAFCTSIKHAEITAQAFRDGGVPALAISGADDDDEIKRKVLAFARREVLVLASCDLMTFGFDLAAYAQMNVTIECMSDLRPTKSLPLQLQKWGRVLRYKDYPAIIFDHAGNCTEHGLPDADRDWSLDGFETGKREGEKTMPTRQCSECYFVHRPAPSCPNCGNVYPVEGRMVEEVDGVLEEISDVRRILPRQEQGMAKDLESLLALGRKKGMQSPKLEYWAAKVLSGREAKQRAAHR